MNIVKNVKKELTKYEIEELEKILNSVQEHEYHWSGLKILNGGYVTAEAYEIDCDEDYDEETDENVDFIEFEITSGIQDMGDGHSSCHKSCHKISRAVVGDKEMSLEDKLKKIEQV